MTDIREIDNSNVAFDDDLEEAAGLVEEKAHFREENEAILLLKKLIAEDTKQKELKPVMHELNGLLHPYLEQPHLLDPYLERLVQPAMERLATLIRRYDDNAQQDSSTSNSKENGGHDNHTDATASYLSEVESEQIYTISYYLQFVMKIRGYKTVVQFMSHQVEDLEPVFRYFCAQDPKNLDLWVVRYTLLLWLSLLCMVPFDLKIVDSQMGLGETSKLVDRYMSTFEAYLNVTGRELEAASYLLAKLTTRQDTAKTHLHGYIDRCIDRITAPESSLFSIIGALTALCFVYKMGARNDLASTVPRVLSSIAYLDEHKNILSNQLVKKLRMKLIARLGVNILPGSMAVWRYTMGKRRLTDHLTENKNENTETNAVAPDNTIDPDYSASIEEIIEHVVQGLKERETATRWLAAKGVGRITLRLPLDMADDVISYVLSLFLEDTFEEPGKTERNLTAASDSTWHGATLAVAELVRRGLILPERLPEVIPWIEQALLFDIKRGSSSIGSNVRDSACYVCWSLARSYAPNVMKPYLKRLAQYLVSVALLDREVHVRRAASAAMQENVGRQGNFPHGIELITMADYFAVGVRVNVYRNIAPRIAKFEEYRRMLIEHLVHYKVNHWDRVIRVLASDSLGKMTRLDPVFVQTEILPQLVNLALSRDLNARHGAILAMAEVSKALSESLGNDASKDYLKPVVELVNTLDRAYLSSFGSELTCYAMNQLAAALCRIALPIPEQLQQDWKKVILLTLARREEPVRKSGSIALAAYDAGYGLSPDELEQLFNSVLTDNNEGLRSGIADAIGLLPAKTLEAYHTRICQLLYTIASGKAKLFDVDTRRNAMRSYAKVFQVIGSKMSIEEFHDMLDAMLSGFGDYTVDIHGDVGSRVREASMLALEQVAIWLQQQQQQQQQQPHLSTLSEALQSDTARKEQIISCTLRQSVERIDRIRHTAGQVLVTLLYKSDLEIAGRTQLTEAIPRDEAIEWISAEAVFPRITPLLDLPHYRKSLLTGIITSGSGMAGNVTGAAIKELTSYVCSLPRADEETSQENKWTADQLVELIQVIGTEHTDNERILQSLYEVLAAVLDAGFAQQLTESAKRLLLKMTNQRFVACRNVQKAKPCIQIYCGLMPEDISDPLWESVLRRLLDCLFHQSSRIRQNTSELLYLCLMGLGVDDIIEDEENNDGTVEECLLATQWDSPLTELKPVCLQLHHMLKVTPTDRLKKRMKLDMPNTS